LKQQQLKVISIILMALVMLSMKSATAKRTYSNHRFAQLNNDVEYINDWSHGDAVEQVTIERKIPVPVFIEKIRHFPVPITKPIFIEKAVPIVHIVPRSKYYHHHHFTEYHHLH
jgi:hypothetical protein